MARHPAPDPPTALRRSGFRRLLGAAGLSNLTDGMRLAGLPLAAAAVTRDPAAVSLVTLATRLPWLMAPLGGVVVDRVSATTAMVVANVVRAVAFGAVFALGVLGSLSIGVLICFGLLIGAAEIIFDTAAQSVIVSVVDEADLEKANARLIGVETALNQFAGQSIAGALAGAMLVAPFGVGVLCLVLGLLLLARLPRRGPRAPRTQSREPRTVRAELGTAARWMAGNRVIRLLVVVVAVFGVLEGIFIGPVVLMALEELHTGRAGYGLLLSLSAVGGLVGAATAARLSQRLGTKPLLVVSTVGAGLAYLLFAMSSSLVPAALALALNAAMTVVWNVVTVSIRQRLVPSELIGRVTAMYRTAAWGAIPLGTLIGGALASTYGLRSPAVVAGAGLVLCAGLVLAFPRDQLSAATAR